MKNIPPIAWIVGGTIILGAIIYMQTFNSLIGSGGSKIPMTLKNITQGTTSVVSDTIGSSLEKTANSIIYLFGGKPTGSIQ